MRERGTVRGNGRDRFTYSSERWAFPSAFEDDPENHQEDDDG